eukprot:TRINITY_DN11097_c0_g1_i1.p1 TRINITY_DN11097_c0_g1~~TRINITY_DN11097_c0_g1_i1.p1  ORF type:complete len:442 (+),score=61.20 TRINITY_DN11097_c0_g1_i1:50-1375(+)
MANSSLGSIFEDMKLQTENMPNWRINEVDQKIDAFVNQFKTDFQEIFNADSLSFNAQKFKEKMSAFNNAFAIQPPQPPQRLPVTTITRPSNLPDKSPEEELRHRKEYEKIMLEYRKKLGREADDIKRKEQMKEEREKRVRYTSEEWKKGDIIADWENKKDDQRTRDLIWQGVPPNMRGQVWPMVIGNALQITPELYQICLENSRKASNPENNDLLGRLGTVTLIPLDLPRTFPALSIFNKDGPCHQQLKEILEAFVSYRPDVGYVQGMSYIAAVLLLYMEPFTAFCCLANLLNKPLLISFYRMDISAIKRHVDMLELLLSEYLPKLAEHFRQLSISLNYFIMDWVLTLFSKPFPLDIVSRVWDSFFLEGEPFFWRTCLGLLYVHEETLLHFTYDECMEFLTHLIQQSLEEETFFKAILCFKLTHRKIQRTLRLVTDSPPTL